MPGFLTRRAVLAGTFTALSPRRGRAARRRVRISQNNSPTSPTGIAIESIAAAIAADPRLSEVLRVDLYHDGTLGDEKAVLQGVREGSVDMALQSSVVLSNAVATLGVLDLPFLFRDQAAARAALDGPIGADLAAAAAEQGLPLLAWGENGMRHITANRPIRAPADLVGLKLRVPQSDILVGGFNALGARTSALQFQALYEQLRTGEFDAEENSIAVIESGRLFEVQKYLSLTGHLYSATAFLASRDLLSELDDAQRAALNLCVREAAADSRRAAEADDRDGIGRLRQAGMTIIDDVDRASFIAAARPYQSAMGQKFGADLVTRLQHIGA
jgi:tripartite ATP-independent transporter DctP family solute receptor